MPVPSPATPIRSRVPMKVLARSPDPYAPPRSQRVLPVVHGSERLESGLLGEARLALAAHCADPSALAGDRQLAQPKPGGLAVTLAALSGTTMLFALTIAGLAIAIISDQDRDLVISLGAFCGALALVLALAARNRHRRDQRLAEQDRSDPVATLRSYISALRFGSPGEVMSRLAPTARTVAIEGPTLGPHRSRRAYRLDSQAAVRDWARTFARSSPSQPRWLVPGDVVLERMTDDLAIVRLRCELRWWPLWSALCIALLAMPLMVFALIPGLVFYLALMQRQPVVMTKHLLRGSDGRWYLVLPGILPE